MDLNSQHLTCKKRVKISRFFYEIKMIYTQNSFNIYVEKQSSIYLHKKQESAVLKFNLLLSCS